MASHIMDAAGVDGKKASLISSGLNIVGEIALCFTPFASIGANMICSGIGGIVGGYISEALGGSFELGAAIGNIVGGIAGGKMYDYAKFSRIAQQGILIGKRGEFEAATASKNLAYYKGMPGYKTIAKVSHGIASKLGWANHHHYISNVMKHGEIIYNLGGPATGSYGKELALIADYLWVINL